MKDAEREKLQQAMDAVKGLMDEKSIIECSCGEQLETDPDEILWDQLDKIHSKLWDLFHE